MVEKEGYIFVFGLDKEGSDKELDAYYELYVKPLRVVGITDGGLLLVLFSLPFFFPLTHSTCIAWSSQV